MMKNSQDIAHRFQHRPRRFQRAYDIRSVSFQRTRMLTAVFITSLTKECMCQRYEC